MRPPDIAYLTDIYLDFGAVAVLKELLERLGVKRPLVVTDAGLVKLGYVARLKIGKPAVFDEIETNPTEASLLKGVAQYKKSKCDGIVALGGGSPMDLAKLLGVLATHPEPIEQYAIVRGGIPKITSKVPPIVAVPTTAGSGSEVGRAALLTLNSGRKLGFLSAHLLPKAAVCDPELTLDLPPGLTAGTGMDAVSHCVETYCSTKVNPVADAIALDGLARGWKYIRQAFIDGKDRPARREMMLCSLMGGLAFQKSLGAVHSLSHPLGALKGKRLHHGTLNALFLPPVLRFNHDACAAKMDAMAKVIGAPSGTALPEAFAKLNEDLKLPARLSEMGVEREELEPLAPLAVEDHCTPTNPRALDVAAARRLYEEAW